ncbi:MAG TPA: hypothetical protein VE962_01430 [Actinomycetota bacterium]|nr:hypothetical protein [Actinomycetota bacterium]
MDVDDRIRTALGRAAPERPATGEVFEHVAARKARRRIVRRLGPPALAVAVVAASAGGYVVLGRFFAGPEEIRPGVASPVPPPSSDLECPGPVPFEPGYLPPGFDPEPVAGPAPGAPPAEEGQQVIHYTDGRRSFEVRRPGTLFVELAQEDDAPTIRVLGTRTADFGPVEPGGDRYIVQFLHPKGSSFEDRCALFSLNEEGLELDELLRVAEGLRPITATLSRCPSLDGSMPRPPDASAQAVDVAVRFTTALRSGDEATAAALLDPAGEGVDDIIGSRGPIPARAVADGPVEGYGFVERDCGTDVADRSWFVIVDDGSDSASLDTTLLLIRRDDGWRIWGAY